MAKQRVSAKPASPPKTQPVEVLEPTPEAVTSSLSELEIGHVLFTEIADYSKLPMDQQTRLLGRLVKLTSNTAEFRRAEERDEVMGLPVGDGMALVFFRDPVAPVRCASEISRELQSYPEIKLRTAIHSGPVYRVKGVGASRNVAGEGINTAQRIVSCGDAGHILLSKTAADTVSQFGNWANCLHEVGECELAPGTRAHLFNLYTGEFGNPAQPESLRSTDKKPAAKVVSIPSPTIKKGAKLYVIIGVALVVLASVIMGYFSLSAAPPMLQKEIYEEFINLNRWKTPSAGWNVQNGELEIDSQPEPGILKDVRCGDFSMNFQVKLINGAGAAWFLRAQKDSKSYYLFYLSGPNGQIRNRLLTYIVRNGTFSPSSFDSSVGLPLQLEVGGDYNIDIKVEGNKFTHAIVDEHTGKPLTLGVYVDPQNTFPVGAVGFRSVGIEKFSISDLYVRPPGAQLPQ